MVNIMRCCGLYLLSMSMIAVGAITSLPARDAVDYRQMRNEIQIFETILRTAIKNEFSHPLALVN